MNEFAIIVAGGSGSRMGSEIPKQFLPLGNLPILAHTIHCFYQYNPTIQIRLVLPEAHINYWQELDAKHPRKADLKVVKGGQTRFQSVRNGLLSIPDADGFVAIHDGVRPLVAHATISASFEAARAHGSGVVYVPLKDSIRKVYNVAHSMAVPRTDYIAMQTPQTFNLSLIKKAFEIDESTEFTDDATVFEASGHQIFLVQGTYSNIKITTKEDLVIAEALKAQKL